MRRLSIVISFALLLSLFAAPVTAAPSERALDIALSAKLTGQDKAALMRKDAPGQSEGKLAEKLAVRQIRLEAKIARFEAKWGTGKPGGGRSVEVHAILAAGCNPGKGEGKALGLKVPRFTAATCGVSQTFVPPGQGQKSEPDDD